MFRLGQRGSGEGDRSRDKVYPKGGEGVISLEMAKKLKAAGLEWEPQEGDLVYHSEKDVNMPEPYTPLAVGSL